MKNKELRFSEGGEQLVDRYFRVLDLGHVGVVSYHGTDALIEAAARCSYQSGTRKVSDRKNLLRYLIRHNHSSPVEQASITFSIKAPLFVIQQILRHRTARLNQESFRYSEVKDEFYAIDKYSWRSQDPNNKQGSDVFLQEEEGEILTDHQNDLQKMMKNHYDFLIGNGVSREIARKEISVSTYSTLYWQIDVRNMFHFLKLRTDSHAQLEIREYANVIACIAKQVFPLAFDAWYDYSYGAVNFTRLDRQLLSMLLYNNRSVNDFSYEQLGLTYHKEIGMSDRELQEFWPKVIFSRFQKNDFDINKCIEIQSNVNGKG